MPAKALSATQAKALEALTHDDDTAIVCYGIQRPYITNGRGYGVPIRRDTHTALWNAGYLKAGKSMYPTRYYINTKGRAALAEWQRSEARQ
jgi:hypothetical protein